MGPRPRCPASGCRLGSHSVRSPYPPSAEGRSGHHIIVRVLQRTYVTAIYQEPDIGGGIGYYGRPCCVRRDAADSYYHAAEDNVVPDYWRKFLSIPSGCYCNRIKTPARIFVSGPISWAFSGHAVQADVFTSYLPAGLFSSNSIRVSTCVLFPSASRTLLTGVKVEVCLFTSVACTVT